jgi:hypothetical protein
MRQMRRWVRRRLLRADRRWYLEQNRWGGVLDELADPLDLRLRSHEPWDSRDARRDRERHRRDLLAFLGLLAAVAAAGTGLLRLLNMHALAGSGGWLSWAEMSVGVGLAGVFLALMVAAYWYTTVDASGLRPLLLALALLVVAVGVCVEALAGLTALLWDRGTLAAAGPGGPSLWRAERYYQWHLVDSVPLLNIPRRLGWATPVRFTDHTAGVLLLLFKLALVAPALRVAIAAYRLVETQAGHAQRRRRQFLNPSAPSRRACGTCASWGRISWSPPGTAATCWPGT